MTDAKHPQVIFCNDSPKRVLVSVIKTTPIKPKAVDSVMPTSPGFSDFMVYPWRWGENAHNVTLSPGSGSGAASPPRSSAAAADPDPEHLKVTPAAPAHSHTHISTVNTPGSPLVPDFFLSWCGAPHSGCPACSC